MFLVKLHTVITFTLVIETWQILYRFGIKLSFLCVTTKITTGRRTKKIKFVNTEFWIRHHSYYRKLWKTIKRSKVYENRDWGYGS